MIIKPSPKWTLWRTKAIEDVIIKIPDANLNKKKCKPDKKQKLFQKKSCQTLNKNHKNQ
jgi:hypothetical protein